MREASKILYDFFALKIPCFIKEKIIVGITVFQFPAIKRIRNVMLLRLAVGQARMIMFFSNHSHEGKVDSLAGEKLSMRSRRRRSLSTQLF